MQNFFDQMRSQWDHAWNDGVAPAMHPHYGLAGYDAKPCISWITHGEKSKRELRGCERTP